MHDELGQRMKENYEFRYKYKLPRRTYTIIRNDGKAFHTLTRHFKKPYDIYFAECMNHTSEMLLEQIQGAKLCFTQSDEISILVTDFDNINTDAWFDGNIQKICSVSASIATCYFNKAIDSYHQLNIRGGQALFDSRVFTIPDKVEVYNYLVWRQKDCIRNSIQMLAAHYFSQKEIDNKNTNELQEMLFTHHNVNWSKEPEWFKNGRLFIKSKDKNENNKYSKTYTEIFTQNTDYILSLIPEYNYEREEHEKE